MYNWSGCFMIIVQASLDLQDPQDQVASMGPRVLLVDKEKVEYEVCPVWQIINIYICPGIKLRNECGTLTL